VDNEGDHTARSQPLTKRADKAAECIDTPILSKEATSASDSSATKDRPSAPADISSLSSTALSSMLTSIPTGIMAVSVEGQIVQCNGIAAAMFGYDPAELIGVSVEMLVPFQVKRYHPSLRNGYTSSPTVPAGRVSRETTGLHQNGKEFPVELGLNRVKLDDKEVITLVTLVDVSGRVGMAELIKQRDAAHQDAEQRRQMLATLSHEIRTPLMGIVGSTDLLASTPLDPAQKHTLQTITGCAEVVLGTIGNVLDYSKLDMGHVHLEEVVFSPAKLISDLEAMFTVQLQAKGITWITKINPRVPSRVIGDFGRYRQVLSNLCSNAIKFTPSGSITVTLDAILGDDDKVRVIASVIDTGIGMTAEIISRIFMPFMQGDVSTTRRFGGSGLGLVICKMLAQLMGGAIRVTSIPGKGSEFTFDALFQAVNKPSFGTGRSSASTGVSDLSTYDKPAFHRALVVEDDAVSRQVISRLLQRLNLEVVTAVDGQDALEILAVDHSFDVVMMDCEMPRMNGFQTTAAIRQNPLTAGLRVIAMTANVMAGDRDRCIAHGMNQYLAKPFRLRELSECLNHQDYHQEGTGGQDVAAVGGIS
jgi:PAS domain S-box-containing protein